MPKKLRFTGEDPPHKYWARYPNWEPALAEEAVEGQDETSLMPSVEQAFIHKDVTFTAGDAWLADGSHYPALIEMGEEGPHGVNVYVEKQAWRVFFNYPQCRWQTFCQDWKPPKERCPSVSLDDPGIFPLRFATRLPRKHGGRPWKIVIRPDGSSEEW